MNDEHTGGFAPCPQEDTTGQSKEQPTDKKEKPSKEES